MVDIDQLDAAATAEAFGISAVAVDIQHPGGDVFPSRAIVSRGVQVRDERGVFVESRCEVALRISESGMGTRGTVVDTGRPNDRWELKSLVYSDSHESCWVATPITQ